MERKANTFGLKGTAEMEAENGEAIIGNKRLNFLKALFFFFSRETAS